MLAWLSRGHATLKGPRMTSSVTTDARETSLRRTSSLKPSRAERPFPLLGDAANPFTFLQQPRSGCGLRAFPLRALLLVGLRVREIVSRRLLGVASSACGWVNGVRLATSPGIADTDFGVSAA